MCNNTERHRPVVVINNNVDVSQFVVDERLELPVGELDIAQRARVNLDGVVAVTVEFRPAGLFETRAEHDFAGLLFRFVDPQVFNLGLMERDGGETESIRSGQRIANLFELSRPHEVHTLELRLGGHADQCVRF